MGGHVAAHRMCITGIQMLIELSASFDVATVRWFNISLCKMVLAVLQDQGL
eukprot:SAG31_NODE_32788_length_351_cov_1.317460_1_plen_50_part_10